MMSLMKIKLYIVLQSMMKIKLYCRNKNQDLWDSHEVSPVSFKLLMSAIKKSHVRFFIQASPVTSVYFTVEPNVFISQCLQLVRKVGNLIWIDYLLGREHTVVLLDVGTYSDSWRSVRVTQFVKRPLSHVDPSELAAPSCR